MLLCTESVYDFPPGSNSPLPFWSTGYCQSKSLSSLPASCLLIQLTDFQIMQLGYVSNFDLTLEFSQWFKLNWVFNEPVNTWPTNRVEGQWGLKKKRPIPSLYFGEREGRNHVCWIQLFAELFCGLFHWANYIYEDKLWQARTHLHGLLCANYIISGLV